MDVQEERYRKVINEYRFPFSNLISEYPIAPSREGAESSRHRNLRYIVNKAVLSSNYPYHNPIYQDTLEQIKANLTDQDPETKTLALRLMRVLPFLYRVRLIENCENEITSAVLSAQRKGGEGFGYECGADCAQLLLSVFELTAQNEDVYFDVNQRILTIFTRFFESTLLQPDKTLFRNGTEVLRCVFSTNGGYIGLRTQSAENKLVSKLLSTLMPASSFVNRQQPSGLNSTLLSTYSDRAKNNSRLLGLILRCREFQARLRARQLYGYCCLTSYLPQMDYELLDVLSRQVFIILENVAECDVALECFACLAVLIAQQQAYYSRNQLLKRWLAILSELSFKKEYLDYYIFLLEVTNLNSFEVPHRLIYSLAILSLQIGRNVQQQYTRFALYIRACTNIVRVSHSAYAKSPTCNLLLNVFQFGWFIDRINQENDLFKSEFLIALLQAWASEGALGGRQEVIDLVDLCHRLIDWKCTSKEETHIPTLKFAFDMYLSFLKGAVAIVGEGLEPCIVELINRCNQPSIYFLFKFKLIATLLELGWYQQNYRYLQSAKLNFQFLQDEVRVVMMPKNPKPIFLFDYSLTYDGEIESRKEIEYIKIIMHLLSLIPKIHEDYAEEVELIIVDYHKYLNELEMKEDSNKELINCLQALEADYYLNDCQRYFLLSLIPNPLSPNSINSQTNLEDSLLYSHCESIECEDEVKIFGPMSPLQLTIKLHPHPSFSSVYIHIKKNQWVQTQSELKLIVSSGVEKKEVPFESAIMEIRVDRIGSLHFQVWKGTENDLLLGSGSYKIRRRLRWRKVNHLRIIDGIRAKAYFKQVEPNSPPQAYLSYYYGEPLLIHVLKSHNEVVVSVSNKEIWNDIRQIVSSLVMELATGSAQIIQDE